MTPLVSRLRRSPPQIKLIQLQHQQIHPRRRKPSARMKRPSRHPIKPNRKTILLTMTSPSRHHFVGLRQDRNHPQNHCLDPRKQHQHQVARQHSLLRLLRPRNQRPVPLPEPAHGQDAHRAPRHISTRSMRGEAEAGAEALKSGLTRKLQHAASTPEPKHCKLHSGIFLTKHGSQSASA